MTEFISKIAKKKLTERAAAPPTEPNFRGWSRVGFRKIKKRKN